MRNEARTKWGVAALVLAVGVGQALARQAPSPPANAPRADVPSPRDVIRLPAAKTAPAGDQAVGPPVIEVLPPAELPPPAPGHTAPVAGPENGAPKGVVGEAGLSGPVAGGPARRASAWSRWCARLQDCFLGYPEELAQPPLGHSVYSHYRTHVANAEAARMVLHHYDFLDGGGLSPRGRERLAEIVAMLPKNTFPVVIEADCAADLNVARRAAVLSELVHSPFPIPPERVVIGKAPGLGLSGVEAVLIFQNLLFQTQRQGVQAGLGGGSIGGTVGQGFSAPGRTAGVP